MCLFLFLIKWSCTKWHTYDLKDLQKLHVKVLKTVGCPTVILCLRRIILVNEFQ